MPIDMLPPPPSAEADLEIQFRTLTDEEIAKAVAPEFAKTGNPLPDPAISTFVGAVLAGEVIAFLCLQLKLHAQPLWIADGYSSVLARLVTAAEQTILARTGPQWVYLFAPAGRLSQLAQMMGMQMEPWVVLSKLVQPVKPLPLAVELPGEALNGNHPEMQFEQEQETIQ